jgi:mRNA-degrading endonuclease toxin of MazEF toxin-antitoxin module
VISLDSFNQRMPVIVVAAITSKIKPAMQITVTLPEGKPLRRAGQILAFQVTTIDQSRLEGYIGCLDAQQVGQLEAALRLAWGL